MNTISEAPPPCRSSEPDRVPAVSAAVTVGNSTTDPSDDPFTSIARMIGNEWPSLARRLLVAHNPGPDVPCYGCTMPGGRCAVEAPCSVRALAELALVLRRRQGA